MKNKWTKALRITIQTVLLVLLILYGISGYGITESRTVEMLTLGMLSKPLAFQVHENLVIPFVIFLLLHIFFRPLYGLFCKTKK